MGNTQASQDVHSTSEDQEGAWRPAKRPREPGCPGIRGPRDQQRGASPNSQEPAHRCSSRGSREQPTAAIVVFVPYRLRDLFRKNQVRLVCELEKKFSGQHVVLVAKRNIQDKEKHSNRKASKGQVRPRSRTLTAVHEAIMSDVVYPANISAKRTRYLLDGSKQIKVELENPYEVSEKLDTFTAVYHALTGKNATFSLPAQEE